MLLTQVRHITVAAWRDVGWVVFAVAVPVGQFAYLAYSVAPAAADVTVNGLPYLLATAAGMIVWSGDHLLHLHAGCARAGPGPEAAQTPARYPADPGGLRGWANPVGAGDRLRHRGARARGGCRLLCAFGVLGRASARHSRAAAVQRALGACGIALASRPPSSKAVVAVDLAVLLQLSSSPTSSGSRTSAWMGIVGSVFPLKHMADSLAAALAPGGPTVGWTSLAVLAAWLLAASLVAVRTFRWDSGRP